MPPILDSFAEAASLYQLGRLAETGDICRNILVREPNHAEALHLLGIVAADEGNPQLAVRLIVTALRTKPRQISYYNDLGNILKRSGSHKEAEAAYRAAIAVEPGNADAHFNLGSLFHQQKHLPAALICYQQSVRLSPGESDAHNNLGSTLHDMGRHSEAVLAFRQALAIRPAYAEAHFNLGSALAAIGEYPEAIRSYNQGIDLRPNYGKAYQNRGNAEECTGDTDAAIASYQLALACAPGNRDMRSNLGLALAFSGDQTGLRYLEQLVDEEPSSPVAHWNLSTALLLHGQYGRGWQEYEWRWQWSGFPSPPRSFAQPVWKGEPLDGTVILLHAEQGLGDSIQFARFIPLVAARGGRVVLEVQAELWRLLKDAPGVDTCIRQYDPRPEFACHCPLMSLPLLLGIEASNIPLPLACDWILDTQQTSFGAQGSRRIGLVWSGNPRHPRDQLRSLKLNDLSTLFSVKSVEFVSLQKGEAATLLRGPEPPFGLTDDCAWCSDFADTAAMIAGLDLIISVDTAVAHLAASMGKPVWLLIPLIPDWRWGLKDETTSWYPFARLFRQANGERWQSVVNKMAGDLAWFAAN